ncbi:hypothetical protein EVAR_99947_1 [Eumeta japonica]|uniref:Uncharacterized protein n=1 Tax=Eumeta variegata TaxID=151549 RepID=A0A4C1ZKC1_EUMVA|nr:hypothetical protein EVAR_99947_1 [Eumeta japonica]
MFARKTLLVNGSAGSSISKPINRLSSRVWCSRLSARGRRGRGICRKRRRATSVTSRRRSRRSLCYASARCTLSADTHVDDSVIRQRHVNAGDKCLLRSDRKLRPPHYYVANSRARDQSPLFCIPNYFNDKCVAVHLSLARAASHTKAFTLRSRGPRMLPRSNIKDVGSLYVYLLRSTAVVIGVVTPTGTIGLMCLRWSETTGSN